MRTRAAAGSETTAFMARKDWPSSREDSEQPAHQGEGDADGVERGADEQAQIQPRVDVPDVIEVSASLRRTLAEVGVGR